MTDISIIQTEHRHLIKKHTHTLYEIIYYLDGDGVMHTASGDLRFSAGNIIIVPPNTVHRSTSEHGFSIFALKGEFESTFNFTEPLLLHDSENHDAKALLSMIYRARISPGDYQRSLVNAFVHFILQNSHLEEPLTLAVRRVINIVSERFYDSDLSVTALLKESGYAEDYIRAHFKKTVGKTPTDFLNSIRISHAVLLIETYKNTFTLTEIADRCGFTDYIYFSRKFKQQVGLSPTAYKKQSDTTV